MLKVPAMPPETVSTTGPVANLRTLPDAGTLADDLRGALDEVADLNNDGVFDEKDIQKAKDDLRDAINARVDIPIIGERIEGLIIGFVLTVLIRVARKRGAKVIEDLIAKIG